MCLCWPYADAWLEDPPARALTPPPPPALAAEPEKIEYEYVSIPCPCGCKPPTFSQTDPQPQQPPATMANKDEDYEHWPSNPQLQAVASTPAPRYDSHNGLYEHTYHPTGVEAKQTHKDDPAQQQPIPYAQGAWMAYPAPAYYGYGGAAYPPPQYTNHTPYPAAAPAPAPAADNDGKNAQPKPAAKEKPKAPSPRKWQGRTRAEVEEDDMKLAASEGAYAARKMAPVGLADDQVVWVVEGEGNNVLRTFAEVRSMPGEWKTDPRFKDSWFFVREVESEEGKK